MAVNHYENFPVASILLPRSVREDVVRLYRFARAADDIADEGEHTTVERRAALAAYRHALIEVTQDPDIKTLGSDELDAIFLPLGQTIRKQQLPLSLLTDLLSAFEQDTQVQRYATEAQLMDYCTRSANPVGRLMLHLFKTTDNQSLVQSDSICTALQRINFLQDVAIDWRKNRIYLPEASMRQAGVTSAHISKGICDAHWQTLMRSQVQICRDLMAHGKPLGRRLSGRIGLEIRLIMAGGSRILDKIEAVGFDIFAHRPTLTKIDWIGLLARALFKP